MALTTFHPFPRLPFELRTQIWEAACLELCRSFRGIHYVTVGSLDVAPLSHNWDGSKPKNNSIYLWDAGLWTACQESKRVIAKHWKKQPRPEHDVDIYNCCSYEEANYYYDTFWPEWDFRNTVTMLYSRVDGEHWRQMVDYRKDLLCVTVDDWEFVAIKSDDIDLRIFLFDDHDVAIEFDPSWLVDLDWHLLSDMPIEERIQKASIEAGSASLAFLIRLLFYNIREDNRHKIILIDKHSKWIKRRGEIMESLIVHDLDEEYVELSGDNPLLRVYSDSSVGSTHVESFIDMLDELFYDEFRDICRRNQCLDTYEYLYGDVAVSFNIQNRFSILVPRANQATDDQIKAYHEYEHEQKQWLASLW